MCAQNSSGHGVGYQAVRMPDNSASEAKLTNKRGKFAGTPRPRMVARDN